MRYFTKTVLILLVLALALPAFAEDQVFTGQVERVTVKATKGGDNYAIVFVKQERTLQGIQYAVDVPMYAFGSSGDKAKTMKSGDHFKAVVSKSERGGNLRYTILAFAD